jgi:hypothetical protein
MMPIRNVCGVMGSLGNAASGASLLVVRRRSVFQST